MFILYDAMLFISHLVMTLPFLFTVGYIFLSLSYSYNLDLKRKTSNICSSQTAKHEFYCTGKPISLTIHIL